MSLLTHRLIKLLTCRPMDLFCVLCLASFLCWITASEAKIVEKILVIVNDDIITGTELDERLFKNKELLRQLYQYDEERLSEEIEKARPEILEQMVDEILFTQEAVKRGIQVSDTEIQKFINDLKNQFGSEEAFQKALDAEGYTLDNFKKEKKKTLLLQRLIEQNFGSELGTKQSSAQVTRLYSKQNLVNRLVVAVVNFPVKKIAGFSSEVLVLGTEAEPDVVVLLDPGSHAQIGARVF